VNIQGGGSGANAFDKEGREKGEKRFGDGRR